MCRRSEQLSAAAGVDELSQPDVLTLLLLKGSVGFDSSSRFGKAYRTSVSGDSAMSVGERQVHCMDALQFLASVSDLPCVLTSLPDITESQGLAQWSDVDGYKTWFVDTCKQMLRRLRTGCAAVIYVTDAQAAFEVGATMLWHKIALRNAVGAVRLGSPAYTHMLCYMSPRSESYSYDVTKSHALPDVIERGNMAWAKGSGVQATYAAMRWLKETLGATEVCDPFCGEGTALAAANLLGMDAVGVEISPKRCKRARRLILQWRDKHLVPLKHEHEIAETSGTGILERGFGGEGERQEAVSNENQ